MNTLLDLMQQRRSIRRFLPKEIPHSKLRNIIEVSRLYPTGGNLQPLRFAIVTDSMSRDLIFADLHWAMYLPDFSIALHERPTAYIIILRDDTVLRHCSYEVGAASTMVMMAATALGLASCAIGSFNIGTLTKLLHLEGSLTPELVIALGFPAQESHVMPMEASVEYVEDSNKNFIVPKWDIEKILVYSDEQTHTSQSSSEKETIPYV